MVHKTCLPPQFDFRRRRCFVPDGHHSRRIGGDVGMAGVRPLAVGRPRADGHRADRGASRDDQRGQCRRHDDMRTTTVHARWAPWWNGNGRLLSSGTALGAGGSGGRAGRRDKARGLDGTDGREGRCGARCQRVAIVTGPLGAAVRRESITLCRSAALQFDPPRGRNGGSRMNAGGSLAEGSSRANGSMVTPGRSLPRVVGRLGQVGWRSRSQSWSGQGSC